MTDPDRRATYAAEDMVMAWLDGVTAETGRVQVRLDQGGRSRQWDFSPETEPRFSRPQDVKSFVAKVMERLGRLPRERRSAYRGREKRPVMVMAVSGWKRARYRNGFILLPQREAGGAWALRGMVVLHELAHHLNTGVDGTIIDEHGEGFRATFVRLLEDIGWMEIAAMLQEAYRQTGCGDRDEGDGGMLAKIGKLLRHAEGAATEAERETFFTKAQELATLHSIELAVARAARTDEEARQRPTFEAVRLGHRGGRSNVRFIELMTAITDANDLRCSIRRDNTGVTLYGYSDDIDVAKALYVSLVVQMVADADAYIRSGAHRPVHGSTARAAFYEGWTERIRFRLKRAQDHAQRDAGVFAPERAKPSGQVTGTKALALAAKELEVDDYFGYMMRQHGIRGTWRGSTRMWDGDSMDRGRVAAERARLRDAKELELS